MKIQNSSISFASTHHESAFSFKESITMDALKSKDAVGAILTLSQENNGKKLTESMVDYQKQEKEEAKKRQQENEARSLANMAKMMRTQNTDNQYAIPEELDIQIKMLRQILAMLRGDKIPEDCKINPGNMNKITDLRSPQYRKFDNSGFVISKNNATSLGNIPAPVVGTSASGTTWQHITATSGFTSESEATTFATKGIVQTSDGRSLDFNLEVSMSRSFMQETNLIEVKDYIKTDPLMINLDTNIGTVTDQKFFFDLDSDGKEENISFAGMGSGFLALDKNDDGKINDGSELFGTTSGDGFKDLAAYDEDGNGWIDENDNIYDKLKVWTKDSDGNDYLIDLKKADVGAIYLGYADTQFSLKNDVNHLNAEIKKTGIYLRESTGAVGTLNHVDLVV